MARTKKSSEKRNARTADLPVNRKKAGDVKGGWPMAAGVAAALIREKISGEMKGVEDNQSMMQFGIQQL